MKKIILIAVILLKIGTCCAQSSIGDYASLKSSKGLRQAEKVSKEAHAKAMDMQRRSIIKEAEEYEIFKAISGITNGIFMGKGNQFLDIIGCRFFHAIAEGKNFNEVQKIFPDTDISVQYEILANTFIDNPGFTRLLIASDRFGYWRNKKKITVLEDYLINKASDATSQHIRKKYPSTSGGGNKK